MLNLKNKKLLQKKCYIDGQWVDADNGEFMAVMNPATGEIITNVPKMSQAEAKRAIDAAEIAQKKWKRLAGKERSAILRKWYNLIMANQEDLAQIITAEMGKPLTEARGEIAYGASYIEWYAEEAKRIYGETIPAPSDDKRIIVMKQPIGVVASITPWNFPNAMITRKVAPALAVGCAVVMKPAEQTPLSALALCVLAEEAGLPKGLINCVVGDPIAIGGEMTANDTIRKVTFTGSTAVGRLLMKQSSSTIKKLGLELGGNAPFIVFDDADIDAAVEGAMVSKFRNSGQTCVCANRIYVQEGIYDAFAEKLAAKVTAMKVGNGVEDGVMQGPLIDMKAVEKVEEHVADAVTKGGEVICGGQRHELGFSFFEPTIIKHISRDMKVAREETFGPVAPLFKFKDVDDVISQANDTEFGLASYFYSKDMSNIFRVAEELEYGMVGVNTGILSNEAAPFGGIKQSGLGREGSKFGLDDYLELKYVCLSEI
ncbi:NAD-dependent succinate-semialdehyde dehydrogenase [Terasakiella sp. A23]|uniref:NAD-dependent succinate-semialdehyde dehydrogenase n=1 Tax=Terasakiella sp. FCG-A23 TaxID=3080561 RepID=UPI0029539ED6|nr:NAD-dependent succinate-semialdehyde dehydrogenase [Terasakiella sp. A23]MDV7341208.1 NAD-dependent succinate-semialdehyde dehydrogenase [Terasakiella sp. A23]